MRRTCCSSTAGSVQLILAGDVDQFVVRNAAPQEEGQARSQFEIGDPVRLAGRDVCGLTLGANQELRAGQNAPQRQLDAVLEGPFVAAFLIKALRPTPCPGA